MQSYEADIWPEGDWWLAKIVSAAKGSNPSPIGHVAMGLTPSEAKFTARDLVKALLGSDDVIVYSQMRPYRAKEK